MSFDALAGHYRWMESVLAGEKLQRCRIAFLDRVTSARDVLLFGEGNGRFLTACRRKMPEARIMVVDSSARMLTEAKQRVNRAGIPVDGIRFAHADALAWNPGAHRYDLIVTHFFLDCFPADQLRQIVANLAGAATPAACWLLADFQIPARGLSRVRARIIHRVMYAFFRVATGLPAHSLAPPDAFVKEHDFVLLEQRTTEWGLLRTDLWKRFRPG